jgi:MFS family permease
MSRTIALQGELNVQSTRLGLRENLGQFSLLLLLNAFVGVMVGMERSVLPLLAERQFGIVSRAAILSFLITFGLVKAIANVFAGATADRGGRHRMMIAGWLAGIPVPLLIMFAPSWGWVIAANVLLGVNQGLCWSTAIVMKVDLVGTRQRGLAIGLNESAGYLAVAGAALATGYLAGQHGLRPWPFLLGMAAAVAGLICSLFVRETHGHVALESRQIGEAGSTPGLVAVFATVSWRNPSLRAVSQAGLVNNLNDGASWGLFPLLFTAQGLSLERTAVLVALYPAVWGGAQLLTGALSDRVGRRRLMTAGMFMQGVALIAVGAAQSWGYWLTAMIALGLGTALVYPTFLSAVSDHSQPSWRATAIGAYRWWRDLGYVVGAILVGVLADRFGIAASVELVGVVTILSGLIVATTYREAAAAQSGASAVLRPALHVTARF